MSITLRSSVAVVTPVAPRDIPHLRIALDSIGSAIMYLADSKMLSAAFPRVRPYIVVDGHLEANERAQVERIVRNAFVHIEFDVRAHILFLEKPVGPGCARNAAIADMEEDDIVFFLDADDVMYPWSMNERLFLHLLTEYPTLVYGQMVLLFEDEQKKKLRNVRECPGSNNLLTLQRNANCLVPGMVCMPAGVIQQAGGFEPHLVCGEDGNLFRRVLEAGVQPMSRDVPVFIYRYRLDSQSKMATSNPEVAEFNEKAFHLQVEPDKHGPTGQGLDADALDRAMAFSAAKESGTWADMLEALSPDTVIAHQGEISSDGRTDHPREDRSDLDQRRPSSEGQRDRQPTN